MKDRIRVAEILVGLFLTPLLLGAGGAWAQADIGASIPVVRAAGVSPVDFDGYLQATGRIGFAQWLDQTHQAESETFSHLVERAQEAWLNGSQTSASNLFKQVIRQAPQADWNASEREAIQYAFLRLAQMSLAANDRDEWLNKAVLYDWKTQPDSTLFPPPLLAAFDVVKKHVLSSATEVKLRDIFPLQQFVRINGQKFNLGQEPVKQVLLPNASFRVSLFSDAYPQASETLTLRQLIDYVPSQLPLVAGSCLQPRATSAPLARTNAVDVMYDPQCVKRLTSRGWDLAEEQSEKRKNSVAGIVPSQFLPHPEEFGLALLPEPEKSQPFITKRTWVWIGISAAATGVAYAVYRANQPRRATTIIDPNSQAMR